MAKNMLGGMSDAKYQAQCDVHTLREAEEINRDKKRLAAARKTAAEKIKELEQVAKPKAAPSKKAAPARKQMRGY